MSWAVKRLSEKFAPTSLPPAEEPESDETPPILVRENLVEIEAHLPEKLQYSTASYAALFGSLSICAEPLAFELVATSERIVTQIVVGQRDENLVMRQLRAFIPDVGFTTRRGGLEEVWGDTGQPHLAVVEFGLGREFMVPMEESRSDPFVGLVGALGDLASDEIGLFQVIFAPARAPWPESIMRSVTHADGSALFVNAPELLGAAKQKVAHPLFAAVVRVAARSPRHDRSWEIACEMAGALGAYGSPRGNELVPLSNEGYPLRQHELDVLTRQTHRSGMILGVDELAGFVHLPSTDVGSPLLRRAREKTKAAPGAIATREGLILGLNTHAGSDSVVALSDDVRARHVHVIGASGTGKSTLLFNLIRQDLDRGYGLTLLDPHGDLVDRVLGAIPPHRTEDVILIDPSDEEYVVGFNVLAAHSDWERNLLASDLVAVFRRLSSAWGDQLNSVLSNALLAFMESDRGGTLMEVRRFLLEPTFRSEFLTTVRDPNILYYWQRAFPALTGNKSVGPVVTRLDTFLSPKALRYMVAQNENRIDFNEAIASGKILLTKLSEGIIGKENSHLLGSFLVSKIQSAAMARQRQSEAARRFHTLYVDEFHNFLTPSLAECLSGVRKYRLGLVLAHQEMRQVERDADVASALLNAGTRLVFRVGDRDARALESGFSSFDSRDIQNLDIGRAICRVERSDWDFNLRVELPGADVNSADRRGFVIEHARRKYGARREDVERALHRIVGVETPTAATAKVEPVNPAASATPPAAPKASEFGGPNRPQKETAAWVQTPTSDISVPVSVQAKGEAKPAAQTRDLGKGGAQHKAIQDRIKEEAEGLGFRVTVEQNFPGLGQIDLVLARDGVSVACEVEVEGTIDYAVRNASKCLKAGFKHVSLVGVSENKISKLSSAVLNSLGVEKARLVSFHLPDGFVASLSTLRASPAPPAAAPRTRGGRVVKRTAVAVSPEVAKAKEEEAFRLMAELMKKKRT